MFLHVYQHHESNQLYLESTAISISASIGAPVASNALSDIHSGIPERTVYFLLSICLRLLKLYPKLMNLSYNEMQLLCKHVFSPCSLLATRTFQFKDPSLREFTLILIWFIMISFNFTSGSSLFGTLLSGFLPHEL